MGDGGSIYIADNFRFQISLIDFSPLITGSEQSIPEMDLCDDPPPLHLFFLLNMLSNVAKVGPSSAGHISIYLNI